jgi:hypothetical protein
MAKKKVVKTGSHLALIKKKGENKELNGLPPQKLEEICLYATDTKKLEAVHDSTKYQDGLVKLKLKFLWEIQEWSQRFDIDANVRVYFELNPEG